MNCQKLIHKNPSTQGKDNILLGIIEKDDSNLIYFKTANKIHVISKSLILSITETNELFRKPENDGSQ